MCTSPQGMNLEGFLFDYFNTPDVALRKWWRIGLTLQDYSQLYKNRVIDDMLEIMSSPSPQILYEAMRYSAQAGGKLLRPLLTLISSEAVGGSVMQAMPAAVAIELVHDFSLVHDDIMDNDDLRRGRPTVHKKWNVNVAILAGDAVLVKAYQALSQVEDRHLMQVLKEFNEGILRVCEGQMMDMDFESRNDVSLDEYFAMIERKTGKLFSLACELGAILGGGGETEIQALKKFGAKIGRAFQIQDDLLDLSADEAVLGKDVGSDLYQDKKTFLMLYSREHADEEQKKRLLKLLGNPGAGVKAVLALFEEIGVVQAAQLEIHHALDDARSAVDIVQHNNAKSALVELIDFVDQREF
ncbi:MAG: polyprenyl synthetase family protein, partial [Calditrichaeota bacterium]